MFCKIFETVKGQVLVKKDVTGDNIPEVKIYFEPLDYGVCNIGISLNDNSKTIDEIFDSIDEQTALSMINKSMEQAGIYLN
jgi:hypothetical protein